MSESPKDDAKTFFPDGKKITIQGEEVTIKPFVLKTRMVVLKLITEILREAVEKNPDLANADTKTAGIALINTAGERIIELYEIVLKKEKVWLENLTMPDELRILKAISEVNDFPFLLREIQSLYEMSKVKD